jgi:hypothetical protein
MDSFTISCQIDSTDYSCALGLEIWVNDQKLLDLTHVDKPLQFQQQIDGADTQYRLCFVMKGKQTEFTTVDQDGNILKDARLILSDLAFDQIPLGHVFTEKALYTHDFNGTASQTQQKFYREIGCNGTVSMDFNTPIYLWLLENM